MSTMIDNVVIIVQARMGSQRWPGKMLAPLLGQPMILWLLERVSRVQVPHRLVVAIPPTPENTPLATLCVRHGYEVMQPDVPENDVLARFLVVAHACNASDIVRLCGDCPFIDPQLIEVILAHHQWYSIGNVDLTAIAPEWPDGQDVEIITRRALEGVTRFELTPREREHVSPGIWSRPLSFCCKQYPCPFDLRQVQWSIDEPWHLDLMERLLKPTLQRCGPRFGWRDLYTTMQLHPGIREAILARPARNSAYVAQMQAEGSKVTDWEALRYGT